MKLTRLAAAVFLWYVATAQAIRADDIDAFVLAQMKTQQIPGLSLAVVRDGRIVKVCGYGFANLEHAVPAKPETVYQSGSLGKQFTATAIVMLAVAGNLNLDDKVGKYLDAVPDAWSKITLRHLLTHTSGIKNYDSTDLNYRRDYTEQELVNKAASMPLDFPAGEKWRYSNTGYALLGAVIRRTSGEFYGDYLQKRVFGPSGMQTARVISEEDIIPNRAAGYRLVRSQLKNQDWVAPSINTMADGSLYLTVLDLAKWDAALYTDRLLPRPSLDQMWTPVKTRDGATHPYGFGWRLGEVAGHKVVRHGGRWQGFTSAIARYPDDKLTVIVLTNLAGCQTEPIVRGVARRYVPALGPAK